MASSPVGEGSIQDYGYDIERVSQMARLGLVYSGIYRADVDGKSSSSPRVQFIPESPMGKINRAAGTENLDLLSVAIDDARTLTLDEFATKYPSFGPY
jgi:hypothetical protein